MSTMRRGGCLVNAARGGHLVDDDVIRATSDGTLSLAFVDGLRQEPLGEDSPLWDAPGVIVTCHSAAYISPDAGPRIIAANIERFDAGEVVSPMYDPGRGF
jgi:glyoxylate/hydroxypyruvate reductase A